MKKLYFIFLFLINIVFANDLKSPITFINIGGSLFIDNPSSGTIDPKLAIYSDKVAVYDDFKQLLSYWDIKKGVLKWSISIKEIDIGISIQDNGEKIILLSTNNILDINSTNGHIDKNISTGNIVRISKDQKYFLVQNGIEKYDLYDIRSKKLIQSFGYYSDVIPDFLVTPNQEHIFFFNNQPAKTEAIKSHIENYPDYFIKRYSIYDGRPSSINFTRHKTGVHSLAMTSDGMKLVSSDLDGWIFVWDANTGEYFQTLPGNRSIMDLSVIQDNKTVIGNTLKGQVFIWNLEDGSVLRVKTKITSAIPIGTKTSINGNLVVSNYYSGFMVSDINSSASIRFIVFNQSEWLVINSDGNFNGSKNCTKYLYKRNNNGEVVLIDERDVKKYLSTDSIIKNLKEEE